jgi:hypothetical protein
MRATVIYRAGDVRATYSLVADWCQKWCQIAGPESGIETGGRSADRALCPMKVRHDAGVGPCPGTPGKRVYGKHRIVGSNPAPSVVPQRLSPLRRGGLTPPSRATATLGLRHVGARRSASASELRRPRRLHRGVEQTDSHIRGMATGLLSRPWPLVFQQAYCCSCSPSRRSRLNSPILGPSTSRCERRWGWWMVSSFGPKPAAPRPTPAGGLGWCCPLGGARSS